jgi:hypothetical protein
MQSPRLLELFTLSLRIATAAAACETDRVHPSCFLHNGRECHQVTCNQEMLKPDDNFNTYCAYMDSLFYVLHECEQDFTVRPKHRGQNLSIASHHVSLLGESRSAEPTGTNLPLLHLVAKRIHW